MRISPFIPCVAAAALSSTLSIAHAETSSATDWSGGDTGEPVTIEILSPEDGAVVPPEFSVVVSTAIVGANGVVEIVSLEVDGEPVDETCDMAGTCTFELQLEAGAHAITAIADSIGEVWTDEIFVTVDGAAGGATGEDSGGDTDAAPGGSDDAADTEAGTEGPPADDLDGEKSGCACSAGEDRNLPPLALGVLALLPAIRRRARR